METASDNKIVPKISKLQINNSEPAPPQAKKDSFALRLELKKAYDYSPPSDKR